MKRAPETRGPDARAKKPSLSFGAHARSAQNDDSLGMQGYRSAEDDHEDRYALRDGSTSKTRGSSVRLRAGRPSIALINSLLLV